MTINSQGDRRNKRVEDTTSSPSTNRLVDATGPEVGKCNRADVKEANRRSRSKADQSRPLRSRDNAVTKLVKSSEVELMFFERSANKIQAVLLMEIGYRLAG